MVVFNEIKIFFLRFRIFLRYGKAALSLLVLLNWSVIQGQALPNSEDGVASQVPPVGTVTMVIGRANLFSTVSGDVRIRRGEILREGDTIRTESNGHVHIRFRDDAVLSVRPSSELEIVAYQFDEKQPGNSQVKFNLIDGTARAVSGKAAKAARERFRLNTPIAAIGVRGTDFVVSTTPNSMMALVNEGSIVVAPYSPQCAAQGIGPCSANSVELDSGSMQILEFDSSMNVPQLVPVLARGQDTQQVAQIFSDVAARNQNFNEEYETEVEIATQSEEEANATVKEVVGESVTSIDLGVDAQNQAPYGTGYTPEVQTGSAELKNRQLVWGRFAEGKGQFERLTLPFSEAAQGRNVTIGGNFEYFLFRPESGEVQVQDGLGEIGFSLSSAQAYFKDGSSVTPVAVAGGDLLIDFNKNVFETSLDLYHMQLGEANFNAQGRLFSGGYFHSREPGSRITGAVSLDGKESGYFFDFFNWDGLLQGITLWDASN
ncbi:MAG: hypothetical protein CBB92_02755 [Flammeovirgaceae bacterium TMED32]|nr:MAG: hypothetical protein CBB92_02755 [Flammeovirgaceae bacterium TMED32]